MLAVDLALAPGESRSCAFFFSFFFSPFSNLLLLRAVTYTLLLPAHLPPTFKGRTLRFSYELVVGACRASGGSSVMKVPIRVYNNVVGASVDRPSLHILVAFLSSVDHSLPIRPPFTTSSLHWH
jgi:hypothetical protein